MPRKVRLEWREFQFEGASQRFLDFESAVQSSTGAFATIGAQIAFEHAPKVVISNAPLYMLRALARQAGIRLPQPLTVPDDYLANYREDWGEDADATVIHY